MTGGVWSVLVVGSSVYAGAANGNAGVYRSDNGGDTWALMDSGLPSGTLVPAMAAVGSAVFAATPNASASGVYRSTDNGGTWTLSKAGGATVGGLATVGSTVYYSARGFVYRSDDDGATWTDVTNGLPLNPGTYESHAVLATGSAVFVHVEYEGIYRSDDDGASWVEKGAGFFFEGSGAANSFAHDGVALFMGGHSGLFRSSDNGETWTSSAAGITRARVLDLTLTNGGIVAGGWEGVFVSSGGGAPWVTGNEGLGKSHVHEFASDGTYVYVAAAGWPNGVGVYRSGTGGLAWEPTTPIPTAATPYVSTTSTVAALGSAIYAGQPGDGLWRSNDAGGTWTSVATPTLAVWKVASNGADLYLGTDNGAYRSSDGGTSWTTLGPAGFTITDVAVVGAGIDVTTTTNGAQAQATSDDGATWSTASLGGSGVALAAHGASVYAATTIDVYRTDDVGQTWVSESSPGLSPGRF